MINDVTAREFGADPMTGRAWLGLDLGPRAVTVLEGLTTVPEASLSAQLAQVVAAVLSRAEAERLYPSEPAPDLAGVPHHEQHETLSGYVRLERGRSAQHNTEHASLLGRLNRIDRWLGELTEVDEAVAGRVDALAGELDELERRVEPGRGSAIRAELEVLGDSVTRLEQTISDRLELLDLRLGLVEFKTRTVPAPRDPAWYGRTDDIGPSLAQPPMEPPRPAGSTLPASDLDPGEPLPPPNATMDELIERDRAAGMEPGASLGGRPSEDREPGGGSAD